MGSDVRHSTAAVEPGDRVAQDLAELELLYATAPVGLCFLDTELRYVRINEELAQMHGRPPAAHLGLPVRAVIAELADVVEPICRRVLESGRPVLDIEVHGRTAARPDAERDWLASYHPVHDRVGRVIGVSVLVQDVTERLRARRDLEQARLALEQHVADRTVQLAATVEQLRAEVAARAQVHAALQASEQRYRELVETLHDIVFSVDTRGCLTYLSPAFETVSGYAPAEMIGRPYLSLVHPDDLSTALESFALSVDGNSRPFECRVLARDGAVRWVRTHTRLVRDADGSAELRGVLTDVTARREAEERARVQHAELAHVQRVATIGEMTAQLAHEINQPLAAIVNYADGMARRLRGDGVDPLRILAVAEQIAAEGRRAAEVIRRLREFVRKGAVQVQASDVNQLVREVVQLCQPEAQQLGVALQTQLDPAAGPIRLDRIQIQQVVMNLLRNGLDALRTVDDGERAVRLSTRGDPPRGVLLSVRDSGIGLPPGADEQIFDAFFTTKPDGLGIGLAISRSIVEAHGGRLWVERNPTRGATFHVHLPATGPT
ncbi:MAG: PAS domain S-box protein [Deltaproteobacteria bacterium]|nr:PAS domain S-box protein [Deltaproteobacteria bacterium]